MDRFARALAAVPALAAALVAGACGEPLIVLGDAPGLMRVVIGVADTAGTRVDTLATRTHLTLPRGIAFRASTGTLYVGDRGSLRQSGGLTTRVARIFEVSPAGRATLLLDVGGCSQGTCMLEPSSMAIAADGSLIIADAVGHRIFRYVPGGALTVIAGTGAAASSPDGTLAATAAIDHPAGIALVEGRIIFSEFGANRIRVIGTDGVLSTLAGTGLRGNAGDGGPATQASLDGPAGIAVNRGTLFFAEQGSHTVRAVDPAGTIRTVAGLPGVEGFQGDGGPATAARLSWPYAVAVAGDGRALFITDRANFRVRVVDLRTGLIRTFAGTGSRRFNGTRLPAGETALADPFGLDASAAGLIFIADSGLGVVWRTSIGFE